MDAPLGSASGHSNADSGADSRAHNPSIYPDYAPRATRAPRPYASVGFGSLVFGVLLPLAVVVIESLTRMCASTFFDPLPTPWHVALALSVPLANAIVWWHFRADSNSSPCSRPLPLTLGLLNGFSIAAAAYYVLLFLPLMPVAFIALVIFGLGLLPLTPLFGLITAVRLRNQMAESTPGLWRGVIAGGLAVAALVMPQLLTSHGLGLASSADPAERDAGVRFLRRFGSEAHLLRASHARPSEFGLWDEFGGRRRSGTQAARAAYYRVTGHPYESVPSPFAARGGYFETTRDFGDRDESLRGGESVGTPLPGLSAATSELHGWLNADAATTYFEWTFLFSNDRPFAQEARTRIALPRGGCVSRLTLWINGEEREAAWGAKGTVRAAYEEVVKVQRRDPVLVTSAGPDRVLMQCFPVPAGGVMQVRVGITAPLALPSAGRGEVGLPRLLDRNFALGDLSPHAVRIVSAAPLDCPGGPLAPDTSAAGGLWGRVTDLQLCAGVRVGATRNPAARLAWFDDTFDRKGGGVVVQQIEPYREQPPSRLVLAIDGSAPMDEALGAVADALKSLPATVAVTALVGTDGAPREFTAGAGAGADVAGALRDVECVGGQDGVPLLARAFDLATREPGAAIVWVYGPQPVELEPTQRLENAVRRSAGAPSRSRVVRVTELQVIHGRNVVADALAGLAAVEPLAAGSDPRAALGAVFADWSAGVEQYRAVRRRPPHRPTGSAVPKGDLQIVRLWAQDEVTNLLASGAPDSRGTATALAVSHQLVTPVSGAVVLETRQQYAAAGLTPVAAVPLPPAAWAALLSLPLLWYASRRLARPAGFRS